MIMIIMMIILILKADDYKNKNNNVNDLAFAPISNQIVNQHEINLHLVPDVYTYLRVNLVCLLNRERNTPVDNHRREFKTRTCCYSTRRRDRHKTRHDNGFNMHIPA